MYSEVYDLSGEDSFKKKFKYYKSNKPKPSHNEIITTDVSNLVEVNACWLSMVQNKWYDRVALLGLQSLQEWKMYTFRNHPGLYLIRNPFTCLGQRYWIRKCLEFYPRKPNKTNIDIEISLQDWWAECHGGGHCNRVLQKKLRWTTLGYHHNWDTKIYSDENRTPFPEDLAELSDVVTQYLGYSNFNAEAAIINYYHMDSTLSPHTDHSEINLDAPLLSFSFGQSAIFLIGGKDKSVEPSAILLNSGDIVIMSKEARLCYHAIPRILPSKDTPWEEISDRKISNCKIQNLKYISNQDEIVSIVNNNDKENWETFGSYIQTSRINMNVRQVLKDKQTNLLDS